MREVLDDAKLTRRAPAAEQMLNAALFSGTGIKLQLKPVAWDGGVPAELIGQSPGRPEAGRRNHVRCLRAAARARAARF